MNLAKLNGNIGLCYVTKNIVLGTDNIINLMRKNKVKLILISSKASFNTIKLIQNKANSFNCKIYLMDESNESILANALGKEKIVVVGITDVKFSKLILKNL